MKKIILTLAVIAGLSVLTGAQTYLTTTTLAVAISSPSGTTPAVTTISLTSTAGITNAYCGGSVNMCALYVDRELMNVVAVPASGTVQVQRGASSTPVSFHAALRTVFIAPKQVYASSDYGLNDGRAPGAPCTVTNFSYLPIINVTNGNIWLCRKGIVSVNGSTVAAAWVATNSGPITYNSILASLQ